MNSQELAKLVRCMCCKELGHNIEVCPRDPNYKTKADNEAELERISKITDFKKGYADTVIQTTQLLKKSVIMPGLQLKNQQITNSSFKRGIMSFDDYNYAAYNKYILIESKEKAMVDVDAMLTSNNKNSNLKKGTLTNNQFGTY